MSSSCSEEVASSSSDRYRLISSLSHAMVQERLDQMIRERQEGSSHVDHQRREQRAVEKCSYDLGEDQGVHGGDDSGKPDRRA
ncbi:hypothetical protein TB1_035330 [Malus domestica]